MGKETIMMIHGMWGAGRFWNNYVDYFKRKGYECLSPTLPLHDENSNEASLSSIGTTSLLEYVEFLEKEIRKMDKPPILVGHSMGGLLAQKLGALGLAKKLVLIAPAPPSGINALKYSVIKSFSNILMTWGFWRKPHRLTFEKSVYSMLHLMSAEEQKKVYDSFVFESGKAMFEIGYWYVDSKKVAKVNETEITCPVLVVSGAEDRITPVTVVRKVAKKYNATYKEFQNHAHWIVSEPDWEDVAGYIFDWLSLK